MRDDDMILINGLKIFAHHGCLESERKNGQIFILSAVLFTSTRCAGICDNLSLTVDYGEICGFIEQIVVKENYNLLEALAERICESVLLCYHAVGKIELEILKPDAPIELSHDSVGVRIARMRHTAYLSLGSNIGERQKHIENAVAVLDADRLTSVKKVSSFIETKPVGYTEQDDFINACVEIETLRTPRELLLLIHDIENAAGRTREIHWGPRTLDIDIILFDDEIICEDGLIIPHREAAKRRFVLEPLCEIAPFAFHPILRASVAELLERLENNEHHCGC